VGIFASGESSLTRTFTVTVDASALNASIGQIYMWVILSPSW
jgi:hypothetical protein